MKFLILFLLLPFAVHSQTLSPLVDYRYLGTVARNTSGDTARSTAVIYAFRKKWRCPSTGLHLGGCEGWAIDHVVPLACGGVDAVYNLQWLPNEAKNTASPLAKDRFERVVYGGNNMSKGCP